MGGGPFEVSAATNPKWKTTVPTNEGGDKMKTPEKKTSSRNDEHGWWSEPKMPQPKKNSSLNGAVPPTRSTNGSANEGIAIPAFLQPLLGLEFVPYMPKGEATTTTTATTTTAATTAADDDADVDVDDDASNENRQKLTDRDLEELGLMGPSDSDVMAESTTGEGFFIEPSVSIPSNSNSFESGSNAADANENGIPEEVDTHTDILVSPKRRFQPKRRITAAISKLVKKGRRRAGSSSSLPLQATDRVPSWAGETSQSDQTDNDTPQTPDLDSSQKELSVSGLGDAAWFDEQKASMTKHQSELSKVQVETLVMKNRTNEIHKRIQQVQNEIVSLHEALEKAEKKLKNELTEFESAKAEMVRLEQTAVKAADAVVESIRKIRLGPLSSSITDIPITPPGNPNQDHDGTLDTPKVVNGTGTANDFPLHSAVDTKPLRPRAATAPTLPTTRAESFIRVHDLQIDGQESHRGEEGMNDSSMNESSSFSSSTTSLNNTPTSGFLFIDSNITLILNNLSKLGYTIAIDEGERFTATRDTDRLLTKYESISFSDTTCKDWPVDPWHAVHGNDILIWTGRVDHTGFGSDWPVVKARGIIQTPPRDLLEFLLDSSKTKQYNKMSQGRQDILTIQSGVDTPASSSPYGFAGDCKIIKSLNKPRLLPKTIEILSLMYSQPLENAPGSYMTVSRSVFEDDSGEHKCTSSTIRSEMLLGVTMIRPADEDHTISEMTTVTHVYSPGVPEMIAKRAAPATASNMIREIQNVFKR